MVVINKMKELKLIIWLVFVADITRDLIGSYKGIILP